jgi:DNA-binding GntR family transcriptional regulator
MDAIDKESALPLYQQLAITIRKQILQGIFRQAINCRRNMNW